ncbi:MAG: lactonase family protein [Saprospiraceae bacterium]
MRILIITVLMTLLFMSCSQKDKISPMKTTSESYTMIVGTYTQKEGHVNGKAEGIYLGYFDSANENINITDTITGIINPSYAIVHPNGKTIYAVSELAGDLPIGKVYAFTKSANDQPFRKVSELPTYGNAPCHIHIDKAHDRLYVVNYMGGIINYGLSEDGSIMADPQIITYKGGIEGSIRQSAPHPHMAQSIENKVFVSDLGTDEIITYNVTENKLLEESIRTKLALGSGPRHFIYHSSNKKIYVMNELNLTIDAYDIGENKIEKSQTIALHNGLKDAAGQSGSAIKIHPSGNHLYAGMRAPNGSMDNTIQHFSILKNGTIQHAGSTYTKGSVPRDFEISPDGKYLLVANQNSDNIVIFSIDESNGNLADTGKEITVKTPVSIKFF